MSSNTPNNSNDQEIDLSQISKKLSLAFEGFLAWIFRGFLFVKRNLILLIVLFVVGVGIGYYLDKTTTIYNHEVIVTPNFGSTEYAYSKVNLIKAKLMEGDEAFLKTIGLKDPKLLSDIDIEPITEIYSFINKNEQNFELIKLMAEDGDINKIIEDKTTSINYTNHRLKITTNKIIDKQSVIEPILKYLNNSDYFKEVQKSVVESLKIRIESNQNTLSQIDSLLTSFSSASSSNGKSDKLVYYNENTQLNDVLKTKSDIIQDIANKKVDLINTTEIVKGHSTVLNIKNNKSVNGKMKLIIPILFIGIFLAFGIIRAFYRTQMSKLQS